MNKWWWRADYVETCNCAHGCPCNFTMIPTHGGCHGVDTYHIREGAFDGVRLDGLNVAMVFAWPGPIHHGHRRAVVYIDERATPEQHAALERIVTGEAGAGGPFEIVDVEIRRRADLEREHRNLKQRHLALDQEHKVLLGKNKAQLEKSAAQSATARAISTRMARRSAANAIRNASSIPAEAIPFVGTAIVLGVTALDLNDACETLKDLNELNTAFDHQPVVQAKVCGMKVPTQDDVLNSIRNNWRATYNEVAKSLDIPSSPQQSPGEIKTRFCSTFSSITGFCR